MIIFRFFIKFLKTQGFRGIQNLAKGFIQAPLLRSLKSGAGFTLIELLVVIAIIAVLAVAIVLALNPTELLKQARDSTRISDLTVLKKAVSLYLTDVSSPSITSSSQRICYVSVVSSSMSTSCNGRSATSQTATSSNNGVYAVDGTGWVPVNFRAISNGSPIGKLPRDPKNTANGATSTNLFYTYVASSSNLTFEFTADMESTKYSASGTADTESRDGGNNNQIYEIGTNLSL